MTVAGQEMCSIPLKIILFGQMQVYVDGCQIALLRDERCLLALLVLRSGHDVKRSWLAETLWPDSEVARNNLAHALNRLKGKLGPMAVCLAGGNSHTWLRFDKREDVWVDTIALASVIESGEDEDTACLEAALDWYRGPLLEDCREEWAGEPRMEWELRYLGALDRMAGRAADQRRYDSAAVWLQRAIGIDPFRESRVCTLMQILADSGDLAAVKKVYRDLCRRLQKEFEHEPQPAPETNALYEALCRRKARIVVPPPVPVEMRHRLPVPLTELIGREQAAEEVCYCLDESRLVTLTGPGGVGKTRVAIAAAYRLLPHLPEGAWFVDLAALSNAALVPQAAARSLGIKERPGQSIEETLAEALISHHLLLILDNCEHLLVAAATLTQRLLSACPEVRILATSRQPLNLPGEQNYPVPPLSLPPAKRTATPSEEADMLLQYAAVRLFVQRARQAAPEFRFDRNNADAVAQICRMLDGNPLALELAAVRVRSLSAAEIVARLEHRFALLNRGNPAAPPRQQNLRAMLDWSYDLLTEPERSALRRVAVFAGGWTLTAAECVCATDAELQENVPDLLTDLVEKSLVSFDREAEQGRYRLLETVREYALEKLAASGESEALRTRHREHYLRLAEEADAHLSGADRGIWLSRLDRDYDNLRAALQWCQEADGGADTGLRLASALGNFWQIRGYLAEGRQHLTGLLAHDDTGVPTQTRARALYKLGGLAVRQADTGAAQTCFTESLTLYQQLGDTPGIAGVLHGLGIVAYRQRNFAQAHSYLQECLTCYTGLQDQNGILNALTTLGNVAYVQDEYETARSHYGESLRLARELDNKTSIANALSNLTLLNRRQGVAPATTRAYYEECLALYRELEDRGGIANALNGLGSLDYDEGDYEAARARIEECLALRREIGDRRGVGGSLNDLGELAFIQGDYDRARHFYEQSLEEKRKLQDPAAIATSLQNLANVARVQGDLATAFAFYSQSLLICRDLKDRRGIAMTLEGLAYLEIATCPERAARLLGQSEKLRAEIGAPLKPVQCKAYDHAVAALRSTMGTEASGSAWAEGHAMTTEQAVVYALQVT